MLVSKILINGTLKYIGLVDVIRNILGVLERGEMKCIRPFPDLTGKSIVLGKVATREADPSTGSYRFTYDGRDTPTGRLERLLMDEIIEGIERKEPQNEITEEELPVYTVDELYEAPLWEGKGVAVIGKVKRVIPRAPEGGDVKRRDGKEYPYECHLEGFQKIGGRSHILLYRSRNRVPPQIGMSIGIVDDHDPYSGKGVITLYGRIYDIKY